MRGGLQSYRVQYWPDTESQFLSFKARNDGSEGGEETELRGSALLAAVVAICHLCHGLYKPLHSSLRFCERRTHSIQVKYKPARPGEPGRATESFNL